MSEDIRVTETTVIPEDLDVSLEVSQNQSWDDKARIREAELSHDLESKKLDFEQERYYNSIPKSDKELELEYAYKNRLLDRQIDQEKYRRTVGYKAEKYSVGGVVLLLIAGACKWVYDHLLGGK